jgi:hypothetical protein
MKFLTGAVVLACCLASSMAAEDNNALMSTALEFLARGGGTSEVLTLNITNLIILGFLAAIVIGLGLFGFGADDDNRRSLSGESASSIAADIVTREVLTGGMCFMMYAAGDESKLSCVQKAACEDPKSGYKYLSAAKMWYKMHKLMKVVPFTDVYYNVMTAVQEATEHSLSGGECSAYHW